MNTQAPSTPSPSIRKRFRQGGLLLLVTAGALLALQGCFRGSWHDPERFDRRAEWVSEEISEELELREDQMPAFEALAQRSKDLARERMEVWRDTATRAQEATNRSPADMDAIADLLKERIHDTSTDARLAALVDDTLSFYNTLDAEQQAIVVEHLTDKLDRHGH